MTVYVPPTYKASAFNCINCGVYAGQAWSSQLMGYRGMHVGSIAWGADFAVSHCRHCDTIVVWHKGTIIHPPISTAAPPSDDMPEEVRADYLEAASIAAKSPRAAAALLRLAVQKLCQALGLPGDNINADIGELVKRGLPVEVQQALDIVRVVGNNAVHPGEISVEDNPEVVDALFPLLNFIVERALTQPKKIAQLFDSLPKGALSAVAKRDRI